jgi:hypothetical protein
MLKEFKRHKLAYTVLGIVLLIVILLFLGAWPNRMLQRGVALFLAIFYVIWGSVTHQKNNNFSAKIFFEYLGVSLLASLLLILITI